MKASSSALAAPPPARTSTPAAAISTVVPAARSTQSRSFTAASTPLNGHADSDPVPPRRRTRTTGDAARTSARNPVPPARRSGNVSDVTRSVTAPGGSLVDVVAGTVDAVVDGTVEPVVEGDVEAVVVVRPSPPPPAEHAASTVMTTAAAPPRATPANRMLATVEGGGALSIRATLEPGAEASLLHHEQGPGAVAPVTAEISWP